MKVALVIDRFLPEKGGTERYVQILAGGLARRGYSVTILAGKFPKVLAMDGVAFQAVYVPFRSSFLGLLLFAHACKKYLNRATFDIVHDVGYCVGADIFNPHGGVEQVWLKRYFKSYSNFLHRLLKRVQRFLSPKQWMMFRLQKRQFTAPNTRRILAISPMIKAHILERYPDLDGRRVNVVLNPADLAVFNPKSRSEYRKATRKTLGLKRNEVVILFAGNNFRLKGLEPLIKSLKLLKNEISPFPSFRLLVAGNDSPDRWRRQCRREGVEPEVMFLGHVQTMRDLYAASDIFAFPTFFDSFSLVVLEALASGLPVVTTKWCGAAFLIESPKTGIILEKDYDIQALAEAIRFYSREETRAETLTSLSSSVISCDTKQHLDQICEIYHQILEEKIHG